MKITDGMTGYSVVANILITIFFLAALPIIHLVLLMRKLYIDSNMSKRLKKKMKKQKKDIIEQA